MRLAIGQVACKLRISGMVGVGLGVGGWVVVGGAGFAVASLCHVAQPVTWRQQRPKHTQRAGVKAVRKLHLHHWLACRAQEIGACHVRQRPTYATLLGTTRHVLRVIMISIFPCNVAVHVNRCFCT